MGRIVVYPDKPGARINRNIYGHFSEHLGRCIYNGIYVGQDSPIPNCRGMRKDVVDALRRIHIPVLRWPGGCIADEYHWRDGVGENRRRMVNTNWGYVVEDNSFGTHEFLELCAQLGCEPYINANVGSGTVREMAEWVEYLNSEGDSTVVRERWANGRKDPWHVKYWGVGNESWGCGGNMRPEYYADEFRRYQTYCRNYGDNVLFKIACGPNTDDYHWTETLMARAGKLMNGLSLHYYTTTGPDWEHKGKCLEFTKEEYYELLSKASYMETLVTNHSAIMDRYDPLHQVGLIVDEWGAWHQVEEGTNPGFLYQQNSMRDALVAAIHLNLFNRHCDRVVMANLAQTVNVLQALILTEGKNMVLTPTYHVFDLFREHQDATLLACETVTDKVGTGTWQVDRITASASQKGRVVTITVANTSMEEGIALPVTVLGMKEAKMRMISGTPEMHNDFVASPIVIRDVPVKADGENTIRAELPACSVAEIRVSL